MGTKVCPGQLAQLYIYIYMRFFDSPAHAQNVLKWDGMGPGCFFPTNPDLADILGGTDLDFEIFYFLELLGF